MIKSIIKFSKGHKIWDRAGSELTRMIGHDDIKEANPFISLNVLDSTNQFKHIKEFSIHPHQGIECDFPCPPFNNGEKISAEESQWLTAGNGILNVEMSEERNKLFGMQLWVELSEQNKAPLQDCLCITNEINGNVKQNRGTVKIITGNFGKIKRIDSEYIKTLIMDIKLNPQKQLSIPVEEKYTILIYILEGNGFFGPGMRKADKKTALIFGKGDKFIASSGPMGLRFVLYGGLPSNKAGKNKKTHKL